MKKKFLVFTLCFTLIFTSINYKKSYAFDMGVVSVPMIATIGTLAIGSGIILNSNDDLYDIAKVFYEKHKSNWETVESIFKASVVIGSNKVVSVGKEFLELVKSAFDDTFVPYDGLSTTETINVSTMYGLPYLSSYSSDFRKYIAKSFVPTINGFSLGDFDFVYNGSNSNNNYKFNIVYNGELVNTSGFYLGQEYRTGILKINSNYYLSFSRNPFSLDSGNVPLTKIGTFTNSYDLPYVPGSYSDDALNEDNLDIYVPGNLGNLVGSLPGDVLVGDVFNPPYELPNGGSVTIPNVDNPSIGTTDDVFVGNPSVDVPGDIPGDIPFANITEYIIGLVVPSDSYWTDTFGGLYNNFTSSFPLVDMSKFNDLVTGEKKFPNIDINIMGVKGRVVNGDVINSIVDWLRPIVAGFMMLCLMLFNYRKIYKTIRGVEPFQGIAQGTSDFRTGISEYNYMGTGLSKSDYEANQMELAKALYDYEQDTGKTYKIKI